MSKESTLGQQCPGCRQMIVFADYHAKHCDKLMTVTLPQKKRKRKRRGK